VRFFLPEGGVSSLDAPGGAFFDPAARAALFRAVETELRPGPNRRLIRLPYNINDAAFAAAVVDEFRRLHGMPRGARRKGGMP
jgi:uncharacterized protein (UPF0261 family)